MAQTAQVSCEPTTTPAARLYCEDCRFYSAPEIAGSFGDARCQRPRTFQAIEYVARAATASAAFCDLQRADPFKCGPSGKWFEAAQAEAAE